MKHNIVPSFSPVSTNLIKPHQTRNRTKLISLSLRFKHLVVLIHQKYGNRKKNMRNKTNLEKSFADRFEICAGAYLPSRAVVMYACNPAGCWMNRHQESWFSGNVFYAYMHVQHLRSPVRPGRMLNYGI